MAGACPEYRPFPELQPCQDHETHVICLATLEHIRDGFPILHEKALTRPIPGRCFLLLSPARLLPPYRDVPLGHFFNPIILMKLGAGLTVKFLSHSEVIQAQRQAR